MPPELSMVAAELSQQGGFLRQELGYQSDHPGQFRQLMLENQQMIRDIERTLRGSGDDLGLVGWVSVIRRSWIALVALLGAAFGYVLNDVVDAVQMPPPTASVIHQEQTTTTNRST